MIKGTAAVIVAAGRGRRMNSPVQKQYMEILGRPMLYYTIAAFEKSPVEQIVLVTGKEDTDFAEKEIVQRFGFRKVAAVIPGGAERYHSVYAGLNFLDHGACGYVLIHDGARPLITADLIKRAIEGAVQYHACVIAVPVKDTIKISNSQGYAVDTPDRSVLWQIQTPQAFQYELLKTAYDQLLSHAEFQYGVTDDAMVVERLTCAKVKLIEGSYGNLKITTPEDMIYAETLLRLKGQE